MGSGGGGRDNGEICEESVCGGRKGQRVRKRERYKGCERWIPV